jgi:hypothetical protein
VKAPGEEQSRNDSPFPARDPLVTELAKAESDLERVEAQRAAANARIDALRKELATFDATPQPAVFEPLPALAPRTPADKVKLFRQLFRGRPDLYPHSTCTRSGSIRQIGAANGIGRGSSPAARLWKAFGPRLLTSLRGLKIVAPLPA